LKPEDIGIFYPRKDAEIMPKFISSLKKFVSAIWLNETPQSRIRVSEPGVKIQTIHSAKGLQYRAVILMWAHLLPSSFKDSDEETDRRLFYVGLTRPEDFLVISASTSNKSKFITEIEKSGKAVIV
jgi:ATP-dependent exoDNAse (exonuclease V) beta subunit